MTIGGGYGIGREVIEFVSHAGPKGGVAAAFLIAILLTAILGMTFDLARRMQVYDYRLFMRELLGRAWVLYEVVLVIALVLVLAVCSSAAGQIVKDHLGWPVQTGVVALLAIVVLLTYHGREWIERTLTFWSVLITILLFVYVAAVMSRNHAEVFSAFKASSVMSGWWKGPALFALYNTFVVPTLLYSAAHIRTRAEAWGAATIGGVLGALPALLYHLSFMPGYPEILEEPLPTMATIQSLGLPILLVVYLILLFGTIAQTGAGILQGINERIENWWQARTGKSIGKLKRGGIAGGTILVSLGLSSFGVVALVAKGYGSAAWLSLGVYIMPLFTVGLWKCFLAKPKE